MGIDDGLPEHITIRFESRDAVGDQQELAHYLLEENLSVEIKQDLRESEHLRDAILYLKPVAVPLALYAGKKLIDVVKDKVQAWIQNKPEISEVALYDAEDKVIKKITRK